MWEMDGEDDCATFSEEDADQSECVIPTLMALAAARAEDPLLLPGSCWAIECLVACKG